MASALVTGATGYLGGVIAAELIDRGFTVLCPVRGEPGRAVAAIAGAAHGFGRDFGPDDSAHVVEVDYDLEAIAVHPLLPEVSLVFHSAVEMSFSPLRLTESFEFNLRGTLALYDLLVERIPVKPRFFYLSTAYAGGIGESSYPETLHVAPRILNPYQASKWATELALHQRCASGLSLPTVIFRPTLVVGHSRTGWYGGKSYGLYSYLDSVHAGVEAGAAELRFDVDPDVAHDYLFIDTMVDDLAVLMERETASFSVVHSTGSRNPNSWRYELVGREFGVKILFERPVTKADKIANRNQIFNEAFNRPGLRWEFETARIPHLLGRERGIAPLDDESLARLIRWYRKHRLGR